MKKKKAKEKAYRERLLELSGDEIINLTSVIAMSRQHMTIQFYLVSGSSFYYTIYHPDDWDWDCNQDDSWQKENDYADAVYKNIISKWRKALAI